MPDLPNRTQHEREIETAVAVLLQRQYRHLVNDPTNAPWADWERETVEALQEPLANTYSAAYQQIGKEHELDESNDRIRGLAIAWALLYSADVGREIMASSRQASADALRRVATEEGLTRKEALAPTFDAPRVERIGITETTRAVTAGERMAVKRATEVMLQRQAAEASGAAAEGKPPPEFKLNLVPVAFWYTERDGRVCPICRPLHGVEEKKWPSPIDGPPAHPRCRCWVEWKVKAA